MTGSLPWPLLGVLGASLLVSLATDLASRRILDVVTYPAFFLALGYRLFSEGLGTPETGLLSGLLGAPLASALFLVSALRGKMGWGDVKLMAVVGACFGWPLSLTALVFVSLCGALQAAVTLLWQGAVWETVSGLFRRLAVRARLASPAGVPDPERRIPYGLAIVAGAFWTVFWSRGQP